MYMLAQKKFICNGKKSKSFGPQTQTDEQTGQKHFATDLWSLWGRKTKLSKESDGIEPPTMGL